MLLFKKMHALGNDILIADATRYPDWERQDIPWKQLGDRHGGVGFDQALLLCQSPDPDCSHAYRVFNTDGSEALQCLNGLRCLGHYLLASSPQTDQVRLLSASGPVTVRRRETGYETITPKPEISLLEAPWNDCDVYEVQTGNSHRVVFTEQLAKSWAQLVVEQNMSDAHKGPNWMLAERINNTTLRMLSYEHGTGPTLACGSGAVACAAAAIASERINAQEPVTIEVAWGKLEVRFGDHHVHLAGPTTDVFTGTFERS